MCSARSSKAAKSCCSADYRKGTDRHEESQDRRAGLRRRHESAGADRRAEKRRAPQRGDRAGDLQQRHRLRAHAGAGGGHRGADDHKKGLRRSGGLRGRDARGAQSALDRPDRARGLYEHPQPALRLALCQAHHQRPPLADPLLLRQGLLRPQGPRGRPRLRRQGHGRHGPLRQRDPRRRQDPPAEGRPVLPGDTPAALQKRVMERAEWIILPEAAELVSSKIIKEKEYRQ